MSSLSNSNWIFAQSNFIFSDPESPDTDGDKTLRRHPRKTPTTTPPISAENSNFTGSETGSPVAAPAPLTDYSGETRETESGASHAEYIRVLTDRLSLSYDF